MIKESVDAIIGELEGIADHAGSWQGDLDDLLKSAIKLPAIIVMYYGSDFEAKRVMGVNRADHTMAFDVIYICKMHRQSDAEKAYDAIDAIRDALIGFKVETYGHLWPVKEQIIYTQGAVVVYGCRYVMETQVTV